jgi:hypothetical protein
MGDEQAGNRTRDDHGADGAIALEPAGERVELCDHARAEEVAGRVVEAHGQHPTDLFGEDDLWHCESSFLRSLRRECIYLSGA